MPNSQTLTDKLVAHEQADDERFATLRRILAAMEGRMDRLEGKVARGAFLGIIIAEAALHSIEQLPSILRILEAL